MSRRGNTKKRERGVASPDSELNAETAGLAPAQRKRRLPSRQARRRRGSGRSTADDPLDSAAPSAVEDSGAEANGGGAGAGADPEDRPPSSQLEDEDGDRGETPDDVPPSDRNDQAALEGAAVMQNLMGRPGFAPDGAAAGLPLLSDEDEDDEPDVPATTGAEDGGAGDDDDDDDDDDDEEEEGLPVPNGGAGAALNGGLAGEEEDDDDDDEAGDADGEEEEEEEEEEEDDEGYESEEMDENELVTRRTRNRIYDAGKGDGVAPPLVPGLGTIPTKKRRGRGSKPPVPVSRAQKRKAGSAVRRRPAFDLLDVEFVFDLATDPCMAYDLESVADNGTDPAQWTSYKLKTQTLYVESATERFELSRELALSADGYDQYRWAKVRTPDELDVAAMTKQSIPLPSSAVDVVAEHLDWYDVEWGHNFVTIRGKTTILRCVRLMHNHVPLLHAGPRPYELDLPANISYQRTRAETAGKDLMPGMGLPPVDPVRIPHRAGYGRGTRLRRSTMQGSKRGRGRGRGRT